jgi:hypothetical protein
MERSMFRSLLDRLIPRPSSNRSRQTPPPRACRLSVEALEDRLTPSSATLSISGDITIIEGNDGTQNAAVTVTLTRPPSNGVSVSYSTVDGSATAGSDYDAVSGRLTFAKNESSKTILVPVRGDRLFESSSEYFSVRLSNVKGARIASSEAYVYISDNEPRVYVSDVYNLREGNEGTTAYEFAVTLSQQYQEAVHIQYTTVDGSATAGSDYTAVSKTLTFQPGETLLKATVLVNGDRLAESDEIFSIHLSSPDSFIQFLDSAAVGYITDDEPRVYVSDVYSLREGNEGTTAYEFVVTLSQQSEEPVHIQYTTADGSATAGSDYTAVTDTLTFEPGETFKKITVLVNGDRLHESDETFSVNLSSTDNFAQISDSAAVGYITDDEPRISITDAYTEGGTVLTFAVSLAYDYDQDVTVNFTTLDGTAFAGIDYVAPSDNMLTFVAGGSTTQYITIDVLDPTTGLGKYLQIQLSDPSPNAILQNNTAFGYFDYTYYYYDPGYYYYDYYYYDYYGYYW